METALLRLFNAVQVDNKDARPYVTDVLGRTVKNGYVLHPSIKPTAGLLASIESIVGISGEKANNAFHKSWSVIRDASIEQLVLQQILHYITTYGFEAWGIYSDEYVYIPRESLELPQLSEDIRLVFIKAMTKEEVYDAVITLASGIALSKDTVADLFEIIKTNQYPASIVKSIGNRELKSTLCDFYGIVPSEPVDYLRFVIKRITGESLIIKNDRLIGIIKQKADSRELDKLLKSAPEDLASIFFRYKPLFLAMKSVSNNKTFFNQLRKKAEFMHKPLNVDYMNDVTSQIKHGKLHLAELQSHLNTATIFRKIRLAYALNYRLQDTDSIVYKVRSGRGWIDDFDWSGNKVDTVNALGMVLNSIAGDISKSVKDKIIYIPEGIHYALPATEKQFSGFIPSNSYMSIPKNDSIIVGLHWADVEHHRIDLDFSLTSATKYGWDSYYRSGNRDIMFSGDLTSAPLPNGATELFYISKIDSPFMLKVNYFNYNQSIPVPCKLFVTGEDKSVVNCNYMVDVSKIIASSNMTLTEKETTLGLLANVNGENRIYFSPTSTGQNISSRVDGLTEKSRKYMIASAMNPLSLNEVLQSAGAVIVNVKPDEGEFIDLSPEALDKNSIISLLQ